ncbi:MAG: hypothetical protein ACPLZY_00375 [Candidatus Norongarragalinales archaeon]
MLNLVLAAVGVIALIVGFLFRLKYNVLSDCDEPPVSVYNKTFSVFDPYTGGRKVIKGFLGLLPFLVLGFACLVVVLFFVIFYAGLVLTAIAATVSVNLLVVDGSFEVYRESRIFIKAFRSEASFGEGDLKVLTILKRALVRLSNYYFGLAAFFLFLALMLPWIEFFCLSAFARLIELVFRGGLAMGVWPPYAVSAVWALVVSAVIILVRMVYGKFLRFTFASEEK